jgi:hypothetical protein
VAGRDRERAREYGRQWREANREKIREQKRQRYRDGYRDGQRRRRNEAAAKLWEEQAGQCYLCGEALESLEAAHLDHDHRCCPSHSFCTVCIRGLSHEGCNLAVGHAADDPDRLERIARNLRIKLTEIDDRLTEKPVQLSLDEVA